MSNEFSGKTAIISGAAGGIGLALAEALAQQGMNIVMGDIDAAALAESGDALRAKGYNVLTCALDVTNYAQWEDVVSSAIAEFGKVHMVVNNAG
ncbi:MAG: SDR family NAD(P)-dependent oxidoreductase, partial [Pseudomonadota bacterium]|nr:SDR family NAD(P)-dependent oxidoreductase [Pseudomonadota bacterium]